MFDQTKTRPDLADRLATVLVALVFLIAFAAIPLAAIDFDRATAAHPRDLQGSAQKAPLTTDEALELATSERCAPCRTVVLHAPSRPVEVPSTGSL